MTGYLIACAVIVLLVVAEHWLRRVGTRQSGESHPMDWHGAVFSAWMIVLTLAATLALIVAIGYVHGLLSGTVSLLTLGVPALGVAYSVRWVNRWSRSSGAKDRRRR